MPIPSGRRALYQCSPLINGPQRIPNSISFAAKQRKRHPITRFCRCTDDFQTNAKFTLGGEDDDPGRVEHVLEHGEDESNKDDLNALAAPIKDGGAGTRAQPPDDPAPQGEDKEAVLAKGAVVAINQAKKYIYKLERDFDALDGAGTKNWKLFIDELRVLAIDLALLGDLRSAHTKLEDLLFHFDKEEEAAKAAAALENTGEEEEEAGPEPEPKTLLAGDDEDDVQAFSAKFDRVVKV